MRIVRLQLSVSSRVRLRRGFTTVELLVVIGIILILAAVLIPALMAVQKRQKVKRVQTEIQLLETALEDFKADFGDYPNLALLQSALTEKNSTLALPSGNNLGNEVLVACLFTHLPALYDKSTYLAASVAGANGDKLKDTDGDGLKEIVDPWERPYIYFHNSEYSSATSTVYSSQTDMDGSAAVTPKADSDGVYYKSTEFQIWSCGLNGINDTISSKTFNGPSDDDIRNWEM